MSSNLLMAAAGKRKFGGAIDYNIVLDTFSSPDDTDLLDHIGEDGQGWLQGPPGSIITNGVVSGPPDNSAPFYFKELNGPDMEVEVTWETYTSSTEDGCYFFACSDEARSNYFMVDISYVGRWLRLTEYVNGVSNVLSTAYRFSVNPNPMILKIVVVGDNVKLYSGTDLIYNFTHNVNVTALNRYCGIRTRQSWCHIDKITGASL